MVAAGTAAKIAAGTAAGATVRVVAETLAGTVSGGIITETDTREGSRCAVIHIHEVRLEILVKCA